MGGPPKLKTVVIPGQKYPEACVWQPTSNLLVLFKFFVGYSFLVSRPRRHYEAPCKGTGGKCEEDDDCCSGRSCFTKGGKDGTCEKECPDDDKYDCYEEPCADKGDQCGDDGDCCDSNKCYARTDGKATCESKCPDDDKYECYEEPCKGTGGGCSKDSECCDGRDCFEKKNGGGTCEMLCGNRWPSARWRRASTPSTRRFPHSCICSMAWRVA